MRSSRAWFFAGASPSAAKRSKQLYVALGDSYATGYPATSRGNGSETRNGYAYQLPALAKAKGYNLRLVNFGCTGATSESIVTNKGCSDLGPGGMPYPGQTQADAAVAYIQTHRRQVAAITISIGGNDVLPCAFNSNPVLVDVTKATGAYGSLDATTKLAPYGVIPVPVAKVCTLTYICRYTDIHPTTAGYRIIAGLVVKALPKHSA